MTVASRRPSRPVNPARILAVLAACCRAGVGLRAGSAPGTVALRGATRLDPPGLAAEVEALGPALRQLVDAEAALAARCDALTRLPHRRPPIPGPGWQGYRAVLEAGCAATDPPTWDARIAAYATTVGTALDAIEAEAYRRGRAEERDDLGP